MRAGPGDSGRTILEAFKPGTAPPDNYAVIGVADADGRIPPPPGMVPDAGSIMRPDAGSIMRPGTGGLTSIALCRGRRYIPRTIHNSGLHRGSEKPCALKSNASLKRSSSLSGC